MKRTERWFISHGIPHFISQSDAARDVLTRAIPLLMLIWAVVGLFAGLGTLFVVARLPREIGRLASFDSDRSVAGLHVSAAENPPTLTRRQWANVGLVVLFSQGLQILLVSALIGAFFVGFGALATDPNMIRSWTGDGVGVLGRVPVWGHEVVLTRELVQVTVFLASFSGLYFAVYAPTDSTHRAEFYEDLVHDVRRAFAVPAVYLSVLSDQDARRTPAGPPDAPSLLR